MAIAASSEDVAVDSETGKGHSLAFTCVLAFQPSIWKRLARDSIAQVLEIVNWSWQVGRDKKMQV